MSRALFESRFFWVRLHFTRFSLISSRIWTHSPFLAIFSVLVRLVNLFLFKMIKMFLFLAFAALAVTSQENILYRKSHTTIVVPEGKDNVSNTTVVIIPVWNLATVDIINFI